MSMTSIVQNLTMERMKLVIVLYVKNLMDLFCRAHITVLTCLKRGRIFPL